MTSSVCVTAWLARTGARAGDAQLREFRHVRAGRLLGAEDAERNREALRPAVDDEGVA